MSLTGPPQVNSRARARIARALTATLALLVAFGCSSGGDSSIEGTTSSTSTASTLSEDTTKTSTGLAEPTDEASATTTSPAGDVPPAHQEVIDRYVAYWNARFAANTGTPNPDDPVLVEYATGPQLEAVVAETRTNLEEGRAFRQRPDPANFQRVTVVSVEGDRAEVQECFVDDGLVVDLQTGAVLDDGVSTHSVRGELQLVDGRWRVASTSIIQSWEGVAGCALAS